MRVTLALVALTALTAPTLAQQVTIQPFRQTAPLVSMSVTAASSPTALGYSGGAPPGAYVCNNGTVDAYVALGDSGVVATTSSFYVKAGVCNSLALNNATYVDAVTASGTTSVTVAVGSGTASLGGGGAAGGGAWMATSGANASVPLTVGSSLYPVYQTQTSTTATTTTASPTITVTAAANIAIGDSIWAAFAPAGAYVANIVGTTVTMSQNATATNASPVAVSFGQSRFSSTSTTLTNTLGAEFGYFGVASKGRSTWVNQWWPGSDNPTIPLLSTSFNGTPAAALATRASDNTQGGSSDVIAQDILTVNDATGTGHQSWGTYVLGLTTPTSIVTQHYNEESSLVNGWTTVDNDPYGVNVTGGMTNLRLDVGDGVHTSNNATDAIEIINNGAAYRAGITISSNALDIGSGRIAPAIQMGSSYAIDWFRSSGNIGWQLYSDASSTNNAMHLADSQVVLAGPGMTVNLQEQNANTQAVLQFTNGNSGLGKWQLGKQTDDSWFQYDIANSANYLTVTTAGNTTLGESGKNTTINGPLQVLSAKTVNYTLTVGDSGKVFTNDAATGEVDFTLPSLPSQKLSYCFTVTAAQVLKVVAGGVGTRIAIGASNSATSGNISASAPYSTACIFNVGTQQWVAKSTTGTWTVT